MMLLGMFLALLVMIFAGLPILLAMGLIGLAGFLSVPRCRARPRHPDPRHALRSASRLRRRD
jgi:hypothetical protein